MSLTLFDACLNIVMPLPDIMIPLKLLKPHHDIVMNMSDDGALIWCELIHQA